MGEAGSAWTAQGVIIRSSNDRHNIAQDDMHDGVCTAKRA